MIEGDTQLRAENQRLRLRVADLEQVVQRLRNAPDEQVARIAKYFGFQPLQSRIVRLLADGRWHSRDDITVHVRCAAGAIKVHVSHMRDGLEIERRRGFGYRLSGDALALVRDVMRGAE